LKDDSGVFAEYSIQDGSVVRQRKRLTSYVLQLPVYNQTGYVQILIVNPMGGTYTFSGFYYSSACPYEGLFSFFFKIVFFKIVFYLFYFYFSKKKKKINIIGQWGEGLDCKSCPDGAICPGGNRIWPQTGW